jgi:aspartyl-tRNA(Asn)/glutamyl-tRNA(Gln) amidotransferase subunit A
MPTTLGEAFKIDEKDVDAAARDRADMLTIGANLGGNPALSLPIGLSPVGLPLGMQIIAAHFDEATLLQVAAELERVLDVPKHPAHRKEAGS